MKKLIVVLFFAAFSLDAMAQDSTRSRDDTPWDYIMMKNGRMIEVQHGKQTLVKKDVTLVNGSTIHPNGKIDDSNGKTLWLKEGHYILMNGKINLLKNMGKTE